MAISFPVKGLVRSKLCCRATDTFGAINWIIISLSLVLATPMATGAQRYSLSDLEQMLGFTFAPEQSQQTLDMLQQYNKFKDNKSLAMAVGKNDRVALGIGAQGSSEADASLVALQYCEQARAAQKIQSDCEIVLQEEQFVPLGRTVLAGVNSTTPSMMWRVTGGAGEFYLGGTIHVLKRTLYPLPAVFEQAFTSAGRVVLETNPLLASDPQRQAAINSLLTADPEQVKASRKRALKRKLVRYVEDQGGDARILAGMQPAMVSLQVALVKFVALGYLPNAGIDLHYARRASASGKAILELESPQEALGPMLELSLVEQNQLLEQTLTELDQAFDTVQPMVNAWVSGDLPQLARLFHKADTTSAASAKLNEKILAGRNKLWLPRITRLLEQGQTTLVLVGAGHMGGTTGLLALLAEAGYKTTQLNRGGNPVPP